MKTRTIKAVKPRNVITKPAKNPLAQIIDDKMTRVTKAVKPEVHVKADQAKRYDPIAELAVEHAARWQDTDLELEQNRREMLIEAATKCDGDEEAIFGYVTLFGETVLTQGMPAPSAKVLKSNVKSVLEAWAVPQIKDGEHLLDVRKELSSAPNYASIVKLARRIRAIAQGKDTSESKQGKKKVTEAQFKDICEKAVERIDRMTLEQADKFWNVVNKACQAKRTPAKKAA